MKKALIFLGLSLLLFSCGKKNNEHINKTEVITGFVVEKEMITAHTTYHFVGKVRTSTYHPAKYYMYVANKEGTNKITIYENDYKEYNVGDYVEVTVKNE